MPDFKVGDVVKLRTNVKAWKSKKGLIVSEGNTAPSGRKATGSWFWVVPFDPDVEYKNSKGERFLGLLPPHFEKVEK